MLKPLFAAVAAASFLLPCARASVDRSTFDLSVKPQDDFYRYANGSWIRKSSIPPDHSSWGSWDEAVERNRAILKGILEKAAAAREAGFIEKLVGDFYHSGMDLAEADAAGAAPLKGEFDRIASIKSAEEIAAEVARLHRLGVGVCFGFASEQDPKNSEMMIAGHVQGGLGLPERDYYLRDDEASRKLRGEYAAHVERMLRLAGDSPSDALAGARAVMNLETALAKGSKTAVDLRDPVANYHLMPVGDVRGLSPHFDWSAYLAGMGLAAPASIDVGQPEFVRALDAQIVKTPIADWRAYFRWHLVHDFAGFLSKPFVEEDFGFFGTALTGATRIQERWKRVLSQLDANAGEALGQLYVAEAFPPRSKVRVLKLVGNIRSSLRGRIESLEWMDQPTREAALRKLDLIGVKIGYTDKWIDYSALAIDRGPYALNVLRANEFNVKRDMAKIGKPVDRTEWWMNPQSVDAYYDPSKNEIVFPAGILQPPFFDPGADDAVNYGGIGMIIGHEMTHGFDDQGRQYDGKGNLSEWWTPESAKRFNERAAGIIKQFNGYVAIESLHVNGELTQGENIADLGGVKLAYSALMKALAGAPAARIDGLTPQQRFFLSFASVWREMDRPEVTRLWVNTDPHSPSFLRVNGPLSNLPEFASAFDVPEGAPMRRPAADRVTIW